MRFVVLFFGFFGVLSMASGGVALMLFDTMLASVDFEWPSTVTEPMGVNSGNAAFFYFVAAGYGLLGVFMAFCRRGKQGAMLMLIPAFGAAFMNPYFAVFGALLAFTALLSLFVGPLPINPPQDDVVEVEPED